MAKIRTGFVSNSSSSSFIVISCNENQMMDKNEAIDDIVNISQDFGEYEFGWQEQQYYDFYSKANFCYIQASYMNPDTKETWINMMEEVIKEYTGAVAVTFDFAQGDGDYLRDAYIDHQSCSCDGQNIEMFNDKETLTNFLFNKNSFIQCDHDNH